RLSHRCPVVSFRRKHRARRPGDLRQPRRRAGSLARPLATGRNSHPHAAWRPAPCRIGSRDRPRQDGARRSPLAQEAEPSAGPDCQGGIMTFALLFTAGLMALLLSLVSFVQLLYLESLRLRTRDLPALEFFKATLEAKLGMKTETGVLSFSLLKYT